MDDTKFMDHLLRFRFAKNSVLCYSIFIDRSKWCKCVICHFIRQVYLLWPELVIGNFFISKKLWNSEEFRENSEFFPLIFFFESK